MLPIRSSQTTGVLVPDVISDLIPNSDPQPRVVKLLSPGLAADTRLKVFNSEFHVHSFLLKHHSAYFRKFLDSPDKMGAIPASAEFKYEWVTKVDDDKKSWYLVSAHNNDSKCDMDLATPTFFQENTFEALLRIMYNNYFSFCDLEALNDLVDIADFYCALKVVSASLDGALVRSGKLFQNAELRTNILRTLSSAVKLRHEAFFKDCLLISLGPYRSPAFPRIEDRKIRHMAQKMHYHLSMKIVAAHDSVLNAMCENSSQHEDTAKRMQDLFANIVVDSHVLDPETKKKRVSLPKYYRRLADFVIQLRNTSSPLASCLAVRELMQNCLKTDVTSSAGSNLLEDHFLCVRFDDMELPWDVNQEEW